MDESHCLPALSSSIMSDINNENIPSPPQRKRTGRPRKQEKRRNQYSTPKGVADHPRQQVTKSSQQQLADANILGSSINGITPKTVERHRSPLSLVKGGVLSSSTDTAQQCAFGNARTPPTRPCNGIALASCSSQTFAFTAASMRASAIELENIAYRGDDDAVKSAYAESQFAGNADILLAKGGVVSRKNPDGSGYSLYSVKCTGFAEQRKFGPTLDRCAECRSAAKQGRQFAARSYQPKIEACGRRTRIDYISRDPRKADCEIRRNREEIADLRRQNAKLQYDKRIAEGRGVEENNSEKVNRMRNAAGIADKEIEERLGHDNASENEKQDFALWRVFLNHLNTVNERNGNKRGIVYDPAILNWAVVFLARTSYRTYIEVAKVLQLPNVSYTYKLSRQIATNFKDRAYGLCPQTIHTIMEMGKAENWKDSAYLLFFSIDSANCATGIQWNNTTKTMVGQCEGHKVNPFAKKFEALAGRKRISDEMEQGREDDGEIEAAAEQQSENVSMYIYYFSAFNWSYYYILTSSVCYIIPSMHRRMLYSTCSRWLKSISLAF